MKTLKGAGILAFESQRIQKSANALALVEGMPKYEIFVPGSREGESTDHTNQTTDEYRKQLRVAVEQFIR